MFGFFKKLKELKNIVEEGEEQAAKYCAMTNEQVAALSDEEFAAAMHCRIFDRVEESGIDSLSKEARAYFIVASYDFDHCEYAKNEIDEYFTGEEMTYATELCDAFEAVGASPYKELFEKFVRKNELDLAELQSMSLRQLKKTLRRCKAFSGKEFDIQYEVLQKRKSLDDITDKYLIANRSVLS